MAENWLTDYNRACDELKEARLQYKLADNALAVANSRLNEAHRAMYRLYQKRMEQVGA